jgi:hypothetical protein
MNLTMKKPGFVAIFKGEPPESWPESSTWSERADPGPSTPLSNEDVVFE